MKKRWVTEILPHSSCITAYAASNASEDFAETYACYMRDPEGLKQALPEKYIYMRDCVFSGEVGDFEGEELGDGSDTSKIGIEAVMPLTSMIANIRNGSIPTGCSVNSANGANKRALACRAFVMAGQNCPPQR